MNRDNKKKSRINICPKTLSFSDIHYFVSLKKINNFENKKILSSDFLYSFCMLRFMSTDGKDIILYTFKMAAV